MLSRRKPLAALAAVTAALAVAVPAASASAAPRAIHTHDGLVCPIVSGGMGISLLNILNLGGQVCPTPNPDPPPVGAPYLAQPILSILSLL